MISSRSLNIFSFVIMDIQVIDPGEDIFHSHSQTLPASSPQMMSVSLPLENNAIYSSHTEAWSQSTANPFNSAAETGTGIQEKEKGWERTSNRKRARKRVLSCCASMVSLPQNFGLVAGLHSENSHSANNGHLCFHRDPRLWVGLTLSAQERLINVLKNSIQHGEVCKSAKHDALTAQGDLNSIHRYTHTHILYTIYNILICIYIYIYTV